MKRFWAKVRKGRGCWLWLAGKTARGYGVYHADGYVRAHRYAYELAVGPIPAGMNVLHRCDNPACVRPSHLFLGTDADNMDDKAAKGRATRGEQVNTAKLTERQVLQIRAAIERGVRQCELAVKYGVSHTAIRYIRERRNWGHL